MWSHSADPAVSASKSMPGKFIVPINGPSFPAEVTNRVPCSTSLWMSFSTLLISKTSRAAGSSVFSKYYSFNPIEKFIIVGSISNQKVSAFTIVSADDFL